MVAALQGICVASCSPLAKSLSPQSQMRIGQTIFGRIPPWQTQFFFYLLKSTNLAIYEGRCVDGLLPYSNLVDSILTCILDQHLQSQHKQGHWDDATDISEPVPVKYQMSVEETLMLKDELAELTGLIPGLGPFCVEFAFSRCVCVGCLRVLWLPAAVQKHACEANWEL